MPIFCRIELIKYIFVYGWNKSNTVLFIEYKIYLGIVGRFHVQVFNQAVNYFFIYLILIYLLLLMNISNAVLFIEYKIYFGIVGRLHVQVFIQM